MKKRALFYNPAALYSGELLRQFGGTHSEEVVNAYKYLYSKNSSSFRCITPRMDCIPSVVPAEIELPIPTICPSNRNKRFSDLCDARAVELQTLAKQSSKELTIFWSGGIDSTVVAAAIMHNKVADVDLSFVLTYMSIYENPVFYKDYIKNQKHTIVNQYTIPLHFNPTKISVTGEGGDFLFAAGITKDLGEASTDSYDLSISSAEHLLFDEALKQFPKEIKSYGEYFWFYLFVNKYQRETMTSLSSKLGIKGNLTKLHASIKRFYATEAFQVWGLYDHLDKNTYSRAEQMRYLQGLDKSGTYQYSKKKLPSQVTILPNSFVYIDQEYNVHTNN